MPVPSKGKTNTWILVDVSNLAHRALYSLGNLEFEDYPTGVIFGFFEQLRTIIRDGRVWSNKVALCFDSKKSYRRKVYPSYKSKRKENRTPDEIKQRQIMEEQMDMLSSKYLKGIGFRMFRQVGLESDDLMAQLALKFRGKKNLKAIILTADGDLCQCITDNVHWYDSSRGVYYTPHSFEKKKGCKPTSYAMVKAIAGCTSDNVKGCPGVGEKSAIDFLGGRLPQHYKKYKSIVSEEGLAIMKRNIPLVKLPHVKTKPMKLKNPRYNPDAFFTMCEELGLHSYLEGARHKEWISIFKGELEIRRSRNKKRGRR